jgi:hypothetical protein
MSEYLVLGICGYAGVGKDLFYEKLSKKIDIKRYALADSLKDELRAVILRDHGIDVTNCTRAEKEIVRPILVNYGRNKRRITEGKYFIDKLNKEILPIQTNVCVTDIRYNFFGNDEVQWLKKDLGGYLIHISQYRVDVEEGARVYKEAANEEEKEHTKMVQDEADYALEWEYVNDTKALDIHMEKFMEWLLIQKQT